MGVAHGNSSKVNIGRTAKNNISQIAGSKGLWLGNKNGLDTLAVQKSWFDGVSSWKVFAVDASWFYGNRCCHNFSHSMCSNYLTRQYGVAIMFVPFTPVPQTGREMWHTGLTVHR